MGARGRLGEGQALGEGEHDESVPLGRVPEGEAPPGGRREVVGGIAAFFGLLFDPVFADSSFFDLLPACVEG